MPYRAWLWGFANSSVGVVAAFAGEAAVTTPHTVVKARRTCPIRRRGLIRCTFPGTGFRPEPNRQCTMKALP
ncbi:hypothetical protein GCM10017774_33380 [Lentzea cavernae]|uniref:Secreted protein n=1 Tax=Lentzea cavernae TaxID=2020703 RepID=A0ABQ3MD14_9PSEU|nr:hypothetical protein GCM10017774_33380 [Lentzea cavernae]